MPSRLPLRILTVDMSRIILGMSLRFLVAAAATLAGAVIVNPLPAITDNGAWCLHVIQRSLDKKDKTTLAPAACTKVANLRCMSWWGPLETSPNAPLIPVCEKLYEAVLSDPKVLFLSGFSFLTKKGGFAAAKKWYLDSNENSIDETLLLALSGVVSASVKDKKVIAMATKPWVVKMYKRLQMAILVDERLVVVNAILETCARFVEGRVTGARFTDPQIAGSTDVTSDYDATFVGAKCELMHYISMGDERVRGFISFFSSHPLFCSRICCRVR
jgi:hypothetical protein